MHLYHFPKCSIQNRNVLISVLKLIQIKIKIVFIATQIYIFFKTVHTRGEWVSDLV